MDGGGLHKGQSFPINELVSDLEWLLAQGVSELERWWDDFNDLNHRDPNDQKRFARTLDAYYRRRQVAYDEVVTHSLPAMRPYLRTLRSMPFRMEIVAEIHERRGYETIALNSLRWPTKNFEGAGVDVVFSDEPPDHHSDDAVERYARKTDALLKRFGRYSNDRVITWGGGVVPDLTGRDTSFGKLPDESAVVSGAMELLKKDLEDLFSELPKGRWQRPVPPNVQMGSEHQDQ